MAKKTEEPVDWQKKKDFGKTPDYINRIKENIQGEYTMIQNLHAQHNDEKYFLFNKGNVFQKKRCEK